MEDGYENPFLLDVVSKETYTAEELRAIQTQLHDPQRYARISAWITSLYRPMETTLEMLQERIGRSQTQILIGDEEEVPRIQDFQIGTGGDGTCAIVCCVPLKNNRHDASQTIRQSLEETGWNGHFLLLQGGFPNPTGTELRYVGVPYCFKIFMMMEAAKRGFTNVLWIDAACYATRNPQDLFTYLDTNPVLSNWYPHHVFATFANTMVPAALDALYEMTESHVGICRKLCTIVFGLKMTHPKIQQFLRDYREMVNIGLPFVSYYPEEAVYSAVLNKNEYKDIQCEYSERNKLYIHQAYFSLDGARSHGYFFLQRQYS